MNLAGLNGSNLAKRAKLSHVAIRNYLLGRIPDRESLKKLAGVFEITMDELLNGVDVGPLPEEKPATHLERVLDGHFPTFAGRIKWLREERLKIPLRKFAESINASKTYIYNLETGKRDNPSTNLLESICAKYDVRMDWLKNGFGIPQHLGATLMGPGGEDIPLSGDGAPLTWLGIGCNPLSAMRVMVAHMDNHELIDKAYRVLDADDIPEGEKITVTKLYIGAVRERLLPNAPEPAQIETSTAKAAMKIRRASIAREEAETAAALARERLTRASEFEGQPALSNESNDEVKKKLADAQAVVIQIEKDIKGIVTRAKAKSPRHKAAASGLSETV